jgi:hypothetical protein
MLTDNQIEAAILKAKADAEAQTGNVPQPSLPDTDKTFRSLKERFQDVIKGFERAKEAWPAGFKFFIEKRNDGGIYITTKFNAAAGVRINLLEISPDNEVSLNGKNISRDNFYADRDAFVTELISSLSFSLFDFKRGREAASRDSSTAAKVVFRKAPQS